MNLKFTIFITITRHFQFYLDFILLFFFLFSQSWYFDWRFGIVNLINEYLPTNTSQQIFVLSIELFRSRLFYFFRIFLKQLFCIILIGQTKPRNVLFQCVNASANEIYSNKNIDNRNYIWIDCRNTTTMKICCTSLVLFTLVLSI